MKTRNTITKLIAITMAVAAMGVTGSSRGNSHVVNTFLYSVPAFGYVPGQTARFSVANPLTQEEGSEPVRVQAYIYDSYGNLLSQTVPVEVPAGQFRTFDFNRDDLRVAGEPGTGRVQVRGSIQVSLMDGSVRSVSYFPVSMEVIDNRTGTTVIHKGSTSDIYLYTDYTNAAQN